MSPEVYIDTSIIGGYYDEEFEFWTKQFFKAVDEGRYKLAVSDLLTQELLEAPQEIRTFLDQIRDKHKSILRRGTVWWKDFKMPDLLDKH